MRVWRPKSALTRVEDQSQLNSAKGSESGETGVLHVREAEGGDDFGNHGLTKNEFVDMRTVLVLAACQEVEGEEDIGVGKEVSFSVLEEGEGVVSKAEKENEYEDSSDCCFRRRRGLGSMPGWRKDGVTVYCGSGNGGCEERGAVLLLGLDSKKHSEN